MPELPEARTIARGLNAFLVGRQIQAVRLLRRDMLKTGTPEALRAALIGQTVQRVDTRGKYVVLHAGQARLVLQLGMAGRVRLIAKDGPPEPHTHLVLHFGEGLEMHYANTRRIASGMHLLPAGQEDLGPLACLGPEATDISLAQLRGRLSKGRRAIKAALLDQSAMAGLGNIYSDEALAMAGLRPTRRCDRLKAADWPALHRAIGRVLADALAAGGSSLRDANPFVDVDGQLGYFAARHRVYGRYGRPCLKCGSTLRRAVVGGRTTTYCGKCQK